MTTVSIIASASELQTDWYIDPTNGKRENTGRLGSPIDSFATMISRLEQLGAGVGRFRKLNFGITYHLLGDIPAYDPMYQRIALGPYGSVDVVGENLTQSRTGTIGTYTAYNPAANAPPRLTDASGALAWTTLDKQLFRMVTGPRAGNGCAWVTKDEGAGVARLGIPTYKSDAFNVAEFAPSAGEQYEIVVPRKIAALGIDVVGALSSTKQACTLRFVRTPGASITGDPAGFLGRGDGLTAFHSEVPWVSTVEPTTFQGCEFTGLFGSGPSMLAYYSVFRTTFAIVQGTLGLGGTTMVQASSPLTLGFSLGNIGVNQHSNSGGIALFDSPSTWLVFDASMHGRLTGRMWGSGNTGAIIEAKNGGRVFLSLQSGGFTALSSSNGNGAYSPGQYDFLVGGKTSLRPIDDSTDDLIATPQDATYAKLIAATSINGFGKAIHDHKSGSGIISA